MQENVLRKGVVNYALARFEEQFRKELYNIDGEMDAMRKRKANLEDQTIRLTAGLASGPNSVTVMAKTAWCEKGTRHISERLLSSGTDSVRFRIKKLRENALRRMTDVRQTLNGDPATARAYLAKHVEKIVMEPDGGVYVATGNGNLLGVGRWDGAEGANCTKCVVPIRFELGLLAVSQAS
jgi:hypothetical protein